MLSFILLRVIHAAFLTLEASINIARRLRLKLQNTITLPPSSPEHVGLVVGEELSPADNHLAQLASLVSWCAAAGVRCITICDAHGELVRATAELRAELRLVGLGDDACVLLEAGEPPQTSARLAVRVVSLRTGRDDIAVAARTLCERVRAGKLPAGSIDEGAVEGELKANAGFPEPELVLQCGPEEHLGGLLPWHCRVTQYAHLGPLGAVSEACARRALVEHAGVTQRHGR